MLTRMGGGRRKRSIGTAPTPNSRITPPAPVNAFIGGAARLRPVGDALRFDRLVTLTGPPGSGKSRIVRQAVAGELLPAPLHYIDVHACTSSGSLAAAFAAAAEQAGEGSAEPLTIIVDGVHEALAATLALLAKRLLERSPQLRLLSTSTRALAAGGEHVYPVAPLSPSESGRLLSTRVREAVGTFEASGQQTAALAAIVEASDGNPALLEELATAAATTGVAAVADALADNPDLAAVAPPFARRIDTCVDQLSGKQRVLLEQLSSIPCHFNLDTAVAVAQLPTVAAAATILDELRQASLVAVHCDRAGELWFRVPRWYRIRAGVAASTGVAQVRYALHIARRLADDRADGPASMWPDVAVAHARAALYILSDARRTAEQRVAALRLWATAEPILRYDAAGDLRERVRALLDSNLRVPADVASAAHYTLAVAQRAHPSDRIKKAPGSFAARAVQLLDAGDDVEAERCLAKAESTSSDPAWTIAVLRGQCEARSGRFDEARRCFLSSFAGDEPGAGPLNGRLGVMLLDGIARSTYARRVTTTATELLSSSLPAQRAYVALRAAQALHALGATDDAASYYRRSEELSRAVGAEALLAYVAIGRTTLACAGGDPSPLLPALEHAMARLVRRGMRDTELVARSVLAIALSKTGEARAAAIELDDAANVARAMSAPWVSAVVDGAAHLCDLSTDRTTPEHALLGDLDPVGSAPWTVGQLRTWHGWRIAGLLAARRVDLAALHVHWHGVEFTPPHGSAVELHAHPTLARVLWCLARQRHEAPGALVSKAELVRRAWPDEKMSSTSGAHRVEEAVSQLRKRGLREIIETRGSCYRIDLATRVVLSR